MDQVVLLGGIIATLVIIVSNNQLIHLPKDEHPLSSLFFEPRAFVRLGDDDNLGSGMSYIPFTDLIHLSHNESILTISLVLRGPRPALSTTYNNPPFRERIPFPCITHNTSPSPVASRPCHRRLNRGDTCIQRNSTSTLHAREHFVPP